MVHNTPDGNLADGTASEEVGLFATDLMNLLRRSILGDSKVLRQPNRVENLRGRLHRIENRVEVRRPNTQQRVLARKVIVLL